MVPATGPAPIPAPKPAPKPEAKPEASLAPATIVVSLPATAKLTIDDAATQQTSDLRVFATPALQPGQVYSYTLKAEIVRDGRTVATSRRVTVQAGQETRVALEFPVTSVAAK